MAPETTDPPLLARHRRASSTRIEDLHAAVEPLAVGHDLRALRPAEPLDGTVNGVVLERLSMVWVRYGGAGVVVETPPTEGHFAMCAPQAPMGVRYQRSGTAAPTSGQLVLSHDEKMWMSPDPVAGCLVVSASMGDLEDHLLAMAGRSAAAPLRFLDAGRQAVRGQAMMEQTWRYVVRVLDAMADSDMHPMALRALEQSLFTAVLLGLPHTATELLVPDAETLPSARAGDLVAWLEANHHRPLGVADIAAAMGVSIRHLQATCRRTHGVTPMALLRAIRLEHARRALREAEPTRASVAAIADRAGFTHLSRFAAAYRRRFGEMPSQTLGSPPVPIR
ncbi:helix-turn-helix domain-containing protein [Actinorugispora endophytica]|uniref:AraC-like DNA-binding protein n=1 Tax=Actinorugispora endophytica TaxID=1605990 RepID=A0A4R6URB5_9ACTN|nr:helix-turn-helix domain-containing protein [Actinorugispora endophytica]TDQ49591.1 AraC-like DNA-binding protein [Actinorugispora endophytica]